MSEKWLYMVVCSYHDVGVHEANANLFSNEEAALRFYEAIIDREKTIFGYDAFTEQGNARDGYTLKTSNADLPYWCLTNDATGGFSEVKIVPTQICRHFDDETEV